ncbi:50S ribosomal protein L22 [Buchnera aphidicola (Mollitrichosiphum nigrofasciatum)]|uniref:50S ribosomal protein L22 n=1 Tax=Buchnera aphidicola TaxID=9 RepID=UPI0031B88569
MTETIAKYIKAPSSPQKLRLVVNLIRGKKVSYALNMLCFSKKKAACLIKKLLHSAIANAEHNHGSDFNKLIISKIFVNEGPTIKRMMPRAKGRADRILKRTSHVTIIVAHK